MRVCRIHEPCDGTRFRPGVRIQGEKPWCARAGEKPVHGPCEAKVFVSSDDACLRNVAANRIGRTVRRCVVVDEDVEVDALVCVKEVAKSADRKVARIPGDNPYVHRRPVSRVGRGGVRMRDHAT